VLDAALPPENEADTVAPHVHVAIAQGREAVRAVLTCVFAVPHTDERLLEELDGGCEHLLARQARPPQRLRRLAANSSKRPREADQPVVLGVVAHATPVGMIAVLLAPPRIAADGLQVPSRIVADPDIAPRRRNDERTDSLERPPMANTAALRVAVDEP
jgi:hypothetical protein